MKIRTRRILIGIGLIVLILLVAGTAFVVQATRVGVAYAAKMAGSAVFVAGRERDAIIADGDLDIVWRVNWEVDYQDKSVTAWLGPISRTAVFRDGLGTALVADRSPDEVRRHVAPPIPGGDVDDPRPWPTGDQLPDVPPPKAVDMPGLEAVLDRAFAEQEQPRRRFGIVVELAAAVDPHVALQIDAARGIADLVVLDS